MEKLTLKGYYQGLKEVNPQKEFKDKVIKATGISNSMFYNYINGRWPVPEIYQQAFIDAAQGSIEILFPKFTYHE